MRSAKENINFPYEMKLVCYFEVDKSGNVKQVNHITISERPKLFDAYRRAKNQATTLYAVWPGQYKSDLFIIDDLKAFARAYNIPN